MKRRILIVLAVLSALACVAMAVLLITNQPLNAMLGPRTRLFYYGGVVGCDYRSSETIAGPTAIIGPPGDDGFIVNLTEIQTWRQRLPPASGWSRAGIGYSEHFFPRADDERQWWAARHYLLVINAEYVLAFLAVVGAAAVAAYVRFRRGEKRLAAGMCVAAGTTCARRASDARSAARRAPSSLSEASETSRRTTRPRRGSS